MPLREQLLQDHLAVTGEEIKPFVALFFFSPFADEQALAFQPPQQRVQRAFVDGHAPFCKGLSQCVAVLLLAQRGQHRQHQRAAAQLQPQVFKQVVVADTRRHIVYATYCITHSIGVKHFLNFFLRGGEA